MDVYYKVHKGNLSTNNKSVDKVSVKTENSQADG